MSTATHPSASPDQGKRLALVIGVNEAPSFHYLSQLEYAVSDAEAMAEVLQRYCGFELFMPPLLGKDATSEKVKQAIYELAENRTNEDFLLLYFSGHGQPMKITGNRRDIYLLTHNFREQDIKQQEDLHFSMRWLRDHLYVPTEAGQVLLILDCCYAGEMGRTASSSGKNSLEVVLQQIDDYFQDPGTEVGEGRRGLRMALTATGYETTAIEKDGHGVMTSLLLRALRGGEMDVLGKNGQVTLELVYNYLSNQMPKIQHPSLSGTFAGRTCILANHPDRVNRPRNVLPSRQSNSFQARLGEFEQLETLMFKQGVEQKPPRIGLVGIGVVGMGGIGKTQLAIELVHRYKDRFPAGVFWMTTAKSQLADLEYQLSELAVNSAYLPPGDDPSNPENEMKRAQYFCQYLSTHDDALLVLDNVEDPVLTLSILTFLANGDLSCTLLYTSRSNLIPAGVNGHCVVKLPLESALRLLLENARPALLTMTLAGSQDAEASAAREICSYVDYLPLALVVLRDLLIRDAQLTTVRLAQVLKQRGTLEIARVRTGTIPSLFATFQISWEKVTSEDARRLLQLAAYFPEAAPIPLWLLGLAAGLGEVGDILEPLGSARIELQELSLLEKWSEREVRLHPLLREFGRRLVSDSGHAGQKLLTEAGQRLLDEFTSLNKLEERTRNEGYWHCIESLQAVTEYSKLLGIKHVERLERITQWLIRESSLLEGSRLWSEGIPGLFYQQLYNHSVEEGLSLVGGIPPDRWLRQMKRVGAGDLSRCVLRHKQIVTSVAFSHDNARVATGSDAGVYLWKAENGQLLTLMRRQRSMGTVVAVTFSPDDTSILAVFDDSLMCIWDAANGQLLSEQEIPFETIACAAFSTNGQRVILGSETRSAAQVRDTASGNIIATLDDSVYDKKYKDDINYTYGVVDVALSHDGSEAIVISRIKTKGIAGGRALVWDIANDNAVAELEFQVPAIGLRTITSASYSPNGTKIVTGSSDHCALIWDAESRKEVATLNPSANYLCDLQSVAFSSNGGQVVTGSADRVARVWDITNQTQVMMLQGHTAPITCAVFSPDGARIVTGSEDQTARIWDLHQKSEKQEEEVSYDHAYSVAVSPDGTKVVATSLVKMTVWDVRSATVMATWEGPGQAEAMTFSPDGRYLLAGEYGGRVFVWEIATRRFLGVLPEKHEGNIESVSFSPDGTKFVTAAWDRTVKLWDAIEGKPLLTLKREESSPKIFIVTSAAFSPDGTKIIAGASDGKVHIWDTASGKLLTTWEDLFPVRTVLFTPDGINALVVSYNMVSIWNTVTPDFLMTLDQTRGNVTNICFSPDKHLLLIGDQHGEVHLWQVGQREYEYRLLGMYAAPYGIGAVHWDGKNQLLLVDQGDQGGHLRFHHLKLEGTW